MAVFAPRYASAFAQVVAAKNIDSAAARQQLRDFAGTLADSRELREVLMNPSIENEQRLRVLDAIAERIGMFRQVRNFVAVIMDHQRLGALNEILTAYDALADERSGFAEAEITSAHASAGRGSNGSLSCRSQSLRAAECVRRTTRMQRCWAARWCGLARRFMTARYAPSCSS